MAMKRRDALVVRLFPGWAQSPVWLPGGPVDLVESLLSRELTENLLTWENRWYAAVQDSGDAGCGEDAGADPTPQERQFLADGKTLAERLAAELGPSFAVSFESGIEEHFLVRSGQPAMNPASAHVFEQWFAAENAVQERLRTAGPGYAYAPLSGNTFGSAPPGPGQPRD